MSLLHLVIKPEELERAQERSRAQQRARDSPEAWQPNFGLQSANTITNTPPTTAADSSSTSQARICGVQAALEKLSRSLQADGTVATVTLGCKRPNGEDTRESSQTSTPLPPVTTVVTSASAVPSGDTFVSAGTMPFSESDQFWEPLTFKEPLQELKGATVAVHATYYLQTLLSKPPSSEPLLSAIGGTPLALKQHIENDLKQWEDHGIHPKFFFDGQAVVGRPEMAMREAKETLAKNEAAWAPYYNHKAEEAVVGFGKTAESKAAEYDRYFQQILTTKNIPFVVGPSSACAQMAYLDSQDDDDIDGILGPLELLVYKINDAVITKMDWENKVARGVVKSSIMAKMNITEETLIDSLLMSGTSFLPPFPVLSDSTVIQKQPFVLKDAINMYRTAGKSIQNLCTTWNDSLQRHEPNWHDKYMKARMALEHPISLSRDGKLIVNQYETLTRDNHEYVGLQLPHEMYHYLVTGMVGPRVYNWLIFLEMLVLPPLDGGDSDEYRQLVSEQLIPIQEQIIALYTSRMHRAFQHKNVTVKLWYDGKKEIKMTHQSVQPPPERQASSWRCTEDIYSKKKSAARGKPGTFGFALKSLTDAKYASSTLFDKGKPPKVSKTTEEVLANTMYRFLHLRGYIGDDHNLTAWGKALVTTLEALPSPNQDEAAFLAFELLRMGQLNARNPHDEWIGAPNQGNQEQNTFCLLVARCACVLKLRHASIGYTGPLSKNLLAYYSIIKAIRECDRDLVDAVVSTLFMYAHADRAHRKDWTQIGLSLPFIDDTNISMGIAVKTYLDEQFAGFRDDEHRAAEKARYKSWPIQHAEDIPGDLELAFGFFDAVRKGVLELGDKIPAEDRTVWEGAAEYLAKRR